MEQGWNEVSAPTAIEEAAYYPKRKRMKTDCTKAICTRCAPDSSNHAAPSEDAQLQLAPLHIVGLVMDPAVRTV